MMTKIKHWLRVNLDLVTNILLGIGAFVVTCGWRALDFTNINLMMSSHASSGIARFDKAHTYVAGLVYRSEPFSWDIFHTYSINPPGGIAGTATDFNPLWSLLFKFFGLFGFDPYWQTMGLLALVSFVLTGVAATYIFRHIFQKNARGGGGTFSVEESRWLVPVASLFFIFSPVMMDRLFVHSNTVTHWIFLFAFVLYLDDRLTRREWILGAILLILSMSMMSPYFLPMTCVPLAALALKQLSEKSISPRGFIYGAIFWSAAIAVMVLLLVPLDNITSVQRVEYGVYSMNLNALFNPIWTKSNIIPAPLGQGPGNYEGDNYLGFGLLVLFVLLIPAAIHAFLKNRSIAEHRWLMTGCGVLLFFALSYKIQLYDFTIFEYDPGITRKIGNIFRRSGSLFWPCWYFLAYLLIWFLFQTRKNAKYILVALAALQLYDLYPTIRQTHESIERWSKTPYQSAFQSEAWDTLFKKYSNVFIVGDFVYTYENMQLYEDLWYMIPTKGIKVNDGLFPVRTKSMQRAKAEENLLKSGVISARLPENTIFIFFSRSIAESYVRHAPSLADHVRQLDGVYYLLWNKDLVEGNNPGSPILRWRACELNIPGTVVQVNRETCEVTSLTDRFGPVTYGPYIYLPQGNYSFEIEYTGTSASAADVGVWDVYTERGRLGMGALSNTHGNRATYHGTLAWPSEYVRDLFEIRTFVQPGARLTIHGIEIKRID